jgi:hypothetical protein
MVYTFVIRSQDKISGTNNNSSYNINFRILPDEIKYYNIHYTFYTTPAFYYDHIDTGPSINNLCGNGWIECNLPFTKSSQSNGSPTKILGNWVRQVDNNADAGTLASGVTAVCYLQAVNGTTNVPRVISRPYIETLNVAVYNSFSNNLMTDSNIDGTLKSDMTNWILTLNLEPVFDDML